MSKPVPIIAHVMGAAFDRLAPALIRFHSMEGRHVFTGWAEVEAPANGAAALLARVMGTPLRAASGPIRFELDASPDAEIWTRHFPSHSLTSRMRRQGMLIVETMGPARLGFHVREVDGGLVMDLAWMRMLGLPCPRFLLPRLVAEETGIGETLHFRIAAALPLLGQVTGYRGHLRIVARETPPETAARALD